MLLFFYLGQMRLMFTCMLGHRVASSLTSTQNFRRVLTALVDSCVEIKECPFSGVTNSGRVWRKVPESDAQSVWCVLVVCACLQTPE